MDSSCRNEVRSLFLNTETDITRWGRWGSDWRGDIGVENREWEGSSKSRMRFLVARSGVRFVAFRTRFNLADSWRLAGSRGKAPSAAQGSLLSAVEL